MVVLGQTSSALSGTAPTTEWQQQYGNNRVESASNVIQTRDGGYAFLDLGWTYQNNLWPSIFYKVDSSGNVQWKKTFNSLLTDSLVQTSDGGYAVLGEYQNGVATLIRMDSAGRTEWAENYTISSPKELLLANDGGFAILSGDTNLNYRPDNSVKGFSQAGTLTKTSSQGIIQWFETFSIQGNFSAISSMIQTNDGGYAFIGSTSYNGTNDTPNLYLWLLKTDSQGNIVLSRQYGYGPTNINANKTLNYGFSSGLNRNVEGDNEGTSIVQTSDGGFAFIGVSYPQNQAGAIMFKTDSQGNVEWNQTFDYIPSALIQTSDNGFAFAGIQNSNVYAFGGIIKTDSRGNLQWTKKLSFLGGSGSYNSLGLSYLIETSDGALTGIGTGTSAELTEANIYLIKTETFLPLPTPSPSQTLSTRKPLNFSVLALIIGTIVAAMLIVVVLLFYLKKNRKMNKEETVSPTRYANLPLLLHQVIKRKLCHLIW